MDKQPFLLRRQAIDDSRKDDLRGFWNAAVRHYGTTADFCRVCPEGIQPLMWPTPILQALCGELLLLPVHDRLKFDHIVADGSVAIAPYSTVVVPTYDVLRKYEVAAALFPMCGGKTPSLGRIWSVRGRDDDLPPELPFALNGAEEILSTARQNGTRLYADTLGVECVGRSWQLAAWLAMHAVWDDQPGKVRIDLASRWIVTGEVVERQMRGVEIGNKPNVPAERDWIIPKGCKETFLDSCKKEGKEVRHHALQTVDDALHLVRGGTQIKSCAPSPFPESIEELHVLFSGSDGAPPDRLLKKARQLRVCCICVPKERWDALRERFRPDQLTHLSTGDVVEKCTAHVRNIASQCRDKDVWIDISNVPWPQQMAVETQARSGGVNLIWWDAGTQRYRKYWYQDGVPHICDLTGV